jgi:hypothetical protein
MIDEFDKNNVRALPTRVRRDRSHSFCSIALGAGRLD